MSRHEPLTPEERALAALLRDTLAAEPSASVDAAVLDAARAALAADAVREGDAGAPTGPRAGVPRRVRRRARWQPLVGIAASVVFAVGIAWQLQPTPAGREVPSLPEALSMTAETTAQPPSHDPAPQPAQPTVAEPVARARTQLPAAAAPQPARGAPEQRRPAPRVAAQPPPQGTAKPAMEAPAARTVAPGRGRDGLAAKEEVQQERMPADRPHAFASSTVAPAAAHGSADAATPAQAEPAARSMTAPPQRALMRAPQVPITQAATDLAGQVRDDARLPRRQWLLKIRQRNDAGDVDGARASLEAYLQAYPATRVPADLRALLDR